MRPLVVAFINDAVELRLLLKEVCDEALRCRDRALVGRPLAQSPVVVPVCAPSRPIIRASLLPALQRRTVRCGKAFVNPSQYSPLPVGCCFSERLLSNQSQTTDLFW